VRVTSVRLVLAIVLLAAGGGAWYLSRPAAGDGKKAPRANVVPVSLAKAELRDMPLALAVTGRTEAFETVTLRSRVEGQVKSVDFTEGRHVNKGDALLRLDAADFQARLDQAEANLSRSRALAAKARADLERAQALRAKGFVSEEKVAEARTTLAAAESSAKADSATSDLARLQLSYTTIRAPFAGLVGSKLVFPGAAVKSNETSLAVINRVRPLHVSFAVPEKYLPRLQSALRPPGRGLTARIALPGGGSSWEADVRAIDNGVDVATGTIQLKARLPNDDEQLAPGQFVEVSLVVETLRNAIVIPAEALQQGADGSFVFVARDDDSVEVRKITLVEVQQRSAIVASGISPGEAVVVEGQLRLTPGARIRRADGTDAKARKTPPASGTDDARPATENRSGKPGKSG